MEIEKRTSKINTWKPTPSQIIVERDGKLFVCHFSKVFNAKLYPELGHKKGEKDFVDRLKPYERFLIGKESYINQLDIITSYTNFFINNYDFEDELVLAYLKIKFALDKQKVFNKENMMAYIDFIYEVMFTDTMIEKIIRMVEENYLDDIESNTTEKQKYLKQKKHLESLEFTNQHIKILLQISFSMKIMSPAIFHYIQLNSIKLEKDSDIIFKFYRRLFDLFGYASTYELDDTTGNIIQDEIPEEDVMKFVKDNQIEPTIIGKDKYYYFINNEGQMVYYTRTKIDLYAKLYVYVKAKVLESNANNAPIFNQREIFGIDVYTVVRQFTNKVLISENVVKYRFNEHYDKKLHKYKENIVGLIFISSTQTLLIAGNF